MWRRALQRRVFKHQIRSTSYTNLVLRRQFCEGQNTFFDFMKGGQKSKFEEDAERKIWVPFHNEKITAEQVIIIDEENEKQGPFPLEEAIQKAKAAGKDLVLTKTGKIPQCKFQDIKEVKKHIRQARAKFVEKQKQKVEKHTKGDVQTPKSVKTKLITFSSRTEEHDLKRFIRNAVNFLETGYPVKVEVVEKSGGFGKNRQPGREDGKHIVEFFEEEIARVASVKNKQRVGNKHVFHLKILESHLKQLRAQQEGELEEKKFKEEFEDDLN